MNHFKVILELSTVTTLHNEHFNSKMRQKKETPKAFDLAINFSDSVEESIKELTDPGYPIFTGERWHYQVPNQSHIKFTKLKLPPSLPSRKLSQADKEALAQYRRDYGKAPPQQKKVRDWTKDNPGRLPLFMYSEVDEDQESGSEGSQSTEIPPPTDSQSQVLGTDNNEQSVNKERSRGTNKQCFIVLDPVEFFSIIITTGRNDEYVRGDVYIFVSDEMVSEELWKKFDIDNATSLVRLSHVVHELDSSAVLLRNDHLLI